MKSFLWGMTLVKILLMISACGNTRKDQTSRIPETRQVSDAASVSEESPQKKESGTEENSGAPLNLRSQKEEVTSLLKEVSFPSDDTDDFNQPACQGSCEEANRSTVLDEESRQIRVCSALPYTMKTSHHEFTVLSPDYDVLWPGSLIQGASVEKGSLDPVFVKGRAPGVVSLAVQTGDGHGASEKINSPSIATVKEAISRLLKAKAGQKFPAIISVRTHSFYSNQQLANSLGTGGGISGGGASLGAAIGGLIGAAAGGIGATIGAPIGAAIGSVNLGFSKEDARTSGKLLNTVILELTQHYYTVTFTPENGGEFFNHLVTKEDLEPYTSEANPVTYIASVTWGRRLFMVFQSDADSNQLKDAVDSYSNLIFINHKHMNSEEEASIIRNAKISILAEGGSAEGFLKSLVPADDKEAEGLFFNPDKLKSWLQTDADFTPATPGVPLSYALRNLRDGSSIKIGMTTDYTKKDCQISGLVEDSWPLEAELRSISVAPECREQPVHYTLKLSYELPKPSTLEIASGVILPGQWQEKPDFPVFRNKIINISQEDGQKITLEMVNETQDFSPLREFDLLWLDRIGSILEWSRDLTGPPLKAEKDNPCRPSLEYSLRWLYRR